MCKDETRKATLKTDVSRLIQQVRAEKPRRRKERSNGDRTARRK